MRQIAIRATSDRTDVYLLNIARRRRRANLAKHTRARSASAQAALADPSKANMKCCGTTRSGHRCQMTAGRSMVDGGGRSVTGTTPLEGSDPFDLNESAPMHLTYRLL